MPSFLRRTRSALLPCCLAASALAIATSTAHAGSLQPDRVFAQYGRGDDRTWSATAGADWDWSRNWNFAGGSLGGYWEIALSHWSTSDTESHASAVLTQLGITPTLRWRADQGRSPWFAEAGIGATVMTPIFQTDDKRFSTAFNFGDHLGVGVDFGERRQHELALRIEHFSNAGISHPNPGENFVQLRYSIGF